MKQLRVFTVLAMMTVLPVMLPAQAVANRDASTTFARGPLYQLRFVVKEVENGKVINSREYYSSLSLNPPGNSSRPFANSGRIRAGSKIPIATANFTQKSDATQRETQFTYIDVGVNIDFRDVQLENEQLLMTVKAEISSVDAATLDAGHQPVIRQMQWESPVSLQMEKPTTIFSSDDVFSKRTTQVEVTAKPIR